VAKGFVDRVDGYHKQNTTDPSKPNHNLTPKQDRRAAQKNGTAMGKAGHGKK
jgi:hypothetical protein